MTASFLMHVALSYPGHDHLLNVFSCVYLSVSVVACRIFISRISALSQTLNEVINRDSCRLSIIVCLRDVFCIEPIGDIAADDAKLTVVPAVNIAGKTWCFLFYSANAQQVRVICDNKLPVRQPTDTVTACSSAQFTR